MNEKISSRQAILLITICRMVNILTIMPIIYIKPSNQDMWIVVIVSFFYTFLISSPLLFLANKFSELNFIGYTKKILGTFIGKIIGIGYIIFYTRTAIVYSYVSIQMIRTRFLPYTRPSIVIIFLIISCVYIASKGSVDIFRYTELVVPIILIFISMFIVFGYKNVDLGILLPIYKDSNLWDINLGGIKLAYLFLDLSILLMISPKLEEKEEKNKIIIKSTLYSLIFVLIAVIVTQGTLGIEQSKHSNFPFLVYIRLIDIFSIIQRVESIYILLWIFSVVIKVTAYIHIADEGMKEIFNNKSENKFLYIIGVICMMIIYYIAEINPQPISAIKFKTWEYIYYFIHKTVIPLIILLVYFIRRKKFQSEKNL